MNITNKPKKAAFVFTSHSPLRAFMTDHIQALSKHYDITIYANFALDRCLDIGSERIKIVHIPFERKIRIWIDLKSMFELYWHLRRGGFNSVHSLMSKAGLYAMSAGFAARIPLRLHMFTGQVWANKRGSFRFVHKSFDRLIAALATNLFTDSPSQRDFLIEQGVIRAAHVLGDGSVCGVNTQKFCPSPENKLELRRTLGIDANAVVFGFLGRLNADKGVLDLAMAFASAELPSNAVLMVVGPDEDDTIAQIHAEVGDLNGRLKLVGFTTTPELYVNMFDVFCLPSYREGFGTSVIEAAACGVPSIVSRIYGLTDAVEEGVTGLMHEPGNRTEIAQALEAMCNDADQRRRLGEAARNRVLMKFKSNKLVDEMIKYYENLYK